MDSQVECFKQNFLYLNLHFLKLFTLLYQNHSNNFLKFSVFEIFDFYRILNFKIHRIVLEENYNFDKKEQKLREVNLEYLKFTKIILINLNINQIN